MTNRRNVALTLSVFLKLLILALVAAGLASWLIPNIVSSNGSKINHAPDGDSKIALNTSNLFGVPLTGAGDLNQAGDYAFLGAGQSALFLRRANTGTTARVLQMGDPVPGISSGQVDLLITPRVNSSAKLAFAADYGTSSNVQRVILVFDGVGFQKTVNSSDIAPGTGGAIFGRFINLAGMNDAGDVAFTGTLVPLGSNANAQTTLFIVPNGGATVRVAGPGDPAPGTGGTFTNISLSNSANSLNNGGEVLFTAQIIGGSGGFGLFAGSTSGVRKVVTNGDPIPGGGTFSITSAPLVSSLRFNNTGQTAFIASPSTTIWIHSTGTGVVKAVAPGDAAPAAIGGTLAVPLSLQAFNDSGAIAFTANVSGSGNTNSGLFRFRSGNPIETVGFVNQPAPGAAPATFSSFSSISMNSTGLVSFRTTLANGSSARGIFQQIGTNLPVNLVLEGETADPVPGGGTVNLLNSTVTRTLNSGLTYGFVDIIGGAADYAELLGNDVSAVSLMTNADTLPAGSRTSQRTFRVGAAGDFVAFLAQQAGGRFSLMARNIATNTTSTLATDGDVAPGTGGGKIRISGFNFVFVNASGTVAFASAIIGGTQGVSSGIFMATPGGGITKLVAAGDLNSGSTFFQPTLNSLPPSPVNATGQVVFRALVLGLNGIYAGSAGGAIQRVAQAGGPAPGGGTFSTFSGAQAINSAGQVAFFATTTGGPGQNQGIFAGTPGGAVAKVAVSGDAAPGGGTFATFANTGFSFNDSGEVAFKATLNGGVVGGAFVGSTSGVQTVALNGAVTPAGGTFALVSANADILINNQHDVVFHSPLNGSGADSGYFLRRGVNGTLQTVAVQGQAAPGTPGTFATIPSTFNNFVGESFSLGPSGEVAFTNSFQTNAGLIFGVFRYRTDNLLEKIFVRGEVIPGTGGIFSGSFAGLAAGGPGHFASWNEIVGGNVSDIIYATNSPAGFGISGQVKDVNGIGIAGVTITLSGSAGGTTTSDGSGNYSFPNLAAGGSYTVTPSSGNFSFSPTNQTFNNLDVNRIANFVGTQTLVTITGKVSDSNNAGVNNVTLGLAKNGVGAGTVQTNAQGDYSFGNLAVGANYLVTPTGTFTPSSQTFSNLTANATANFKAASSIPSQCNTVSFAAAGNFAAGTGPRDIAVGDFNGDGKLDLAVVNRFSDNVSILLATGTGSFSAATNFGVGTAPIGVAVGDFNNDGKLDLAVTNNSSNSVSILLGTGTGSFSAATNFAVGVNPDLVSVGDFNVDGKLDLAVANCGSNTVSILLGTGTGSFSAPTNLAVGGCVSVAVGDFNGDGKLDLAVSNNGSNNVSIFLGTGTGSFSAPTNFAVGTLPDGIAVGDFNGDGRLDLAVANNGSANVSILLGTGTGSFSAATNFAVSALPGGFVVGDFNGDGKLDLGLGYDSSNNVSILLGAGTGSFGAPINFDVGGVTKGGAVGDFNGDGKLDFAVTIDTPNNVSIFLNNGAICNAQTSLSISGQLTNVSNQPLSDVAVTLTGPISRVTSTDASGNYSFPNLVPGGNYTVTVQTPYFVVAPTRADFFNLSSSQIANFIAAPVAVPSPTPPLSDDFTSTVRDATKWTIGAQTSSPVAFDPQVTTAQVNGQLVITPLTQAVGLHYAGYVSANSFDIRNGKASVEVVKAATGGADTIFAIGSDSDNFFRFLVHTPGTPTALAPTAKGRDGVERPLDATAPQLVFQVKINGVITSLSINYDPVQHRFMRFRHDPPANAIDFETSPNSLDWTLQKSVPLQKGVSALTAELSAGTSNPANPGQTIFDNFSLVTSTFQFSPGTYTVGEGDQRVSLTVTRVGDTTGTAIVGFATDDAAGLQNCNITNVVASPRCDYINTSGTLTFAPGVTSRSFSVAIVDDTYPEGDESFTVSLSNASALAAPARAKVTIIDNDSSNGANAIDNTSFFVRQQYIDFLGREPDSFGFPIWVSTINNCAPGDTSCDRIHVSQQFFQSTEFQERGYFVYRFYNVAFGRKPDYGEFVPDLASVSGFLDANQLEAAKLAFIAAFMARPAFVSTYNSPNTPTGNQQYVDALLNTAGVTLSSRQAMIDGLNNATMTRAVVLRTIVESTEVSVKYNHQAYAVMEYFGYLRRQPDSFYLDWIAELDRTNNPRGMVTGFATSTEYRSRFGP